MKQNQGFSLIEIMIAVTVLGIIALLWIPSYRLIVDKSEATTTANDMRTFTDAVEFYSTAEGSYPSSMNHSAIPDLISQYLPAVWRNGDLSWSYVNTSENIYVQLNNLGFTAEQFLRLDHIIDDGNIVTGNARVAIGGSGMVYHFVTADPTPSSPSTTSSPPRRGPGDIVRISAEVNF